MVLIDICNTLKLNNNGIKNCETQIRLCIRQSLLVYSSIIPVSYTHLDVYKRQGSLVVVASATSLVDVRVAAPPSRQIRSRARENR